ncbi:MAG TPA: Uma2 family endonuclease [Bryobacteraceae bacterium]|jgi:Uma2 family endonuclease|nr:Uma2 family endonuclease [Bryobacteraceae bacterium]
MPTAELISVTEYLATDYSPDCDFVDGVLEDRHVGERDHGLVQAALIVWFAAHRKELGIAVVPEQRIQVTGSRYRLPDVCVTIGLPDEQVFTTPPFLCIEILSPEDQMGRVLTKVADYLNFGVPYVWLIDPRKRTAVVYTANEALPVNDGVLRTTNPDIALPLTDLF